MRFLANFEDFGYSVVSISRLYYSYCDHELCFSTLDGDWYKIHLDDPDLASDIISDCLTDGYSGLGDYVAYPFDKSDFLEE